MSPAMRHGFVQLAGQWLAHRCDERGNLWFRDACEALSSRPDERALGIMIGQVPRRLGKAALRLDANDLAAAALRPGLDPSEWSVDQAARIALMLASYRDESSFAATLDRFCATAEINEMIAICRGLPLYPAADLIVPRAREAIRSGIRPVFESVAHRNPFPGEMFAEADWIQMVVKAVFIEATLWPIQRLDDRNNPQLARMLVALVNERRAAGRPISAEVWRCIVPHADDDGVAAMIDAWDGDAPNHRHAIALALKSAPDRAARLPFRDQLPGVELDIAAAAIDWHALEA